MVRGSGGVLDVAPVPTIAEEASSIRPLVTQRAAAATTTTNNMAITERRQRPHSQALVKPGRFATTGRHRAETQPGPMFWLYTVPHQSFGLDGNTDSKDSFCVPARGFRSGDVGDSMPRRVPLIPA
jgi:hypothetical protein